MPPIYIDVATVAGVVVLFGMKFFILNRGKNPRLEWQQWLLATVAGMAVSVTIRYFSG